MIGQTLGKYEVLDKLGEGGMGEVYKAKDTRLDRTVAVKVLPSHLADKPELKQRLEREARAVSSLNHPHICTLHDFGEHEGVDYLVMEFLEGETLADRLKKGALPLDQALRYAVEIADALDKAHRQGVVHRDLKPGNIMLTTSGAKLMDFGLAKLRADVSAGTSSMLSALPTEEKPLTEKGTLVGTFQYMAPEQLEAKEADTRTDIFAFGAVLYEMVTGKKAFEGASQASLITAIMSSEPRPMSELQPMTPTFLDWAVKRCLEKVPDERWQSAKDLEAQLKLIVEGDASVEATTPQRPKSRERLAWILVALLSLLGVVLAWAYVGQAPAEEVTLRYEIDPPTGTSFSSDMAAGIPIVSPDGRSLAFIADEAIWIRPLDELKARRLPGTEGVMSFFWSPDSQSIAFLGPGKLMTVSIEGGLPHSICDKSADVLRFGGAWGRDGTILFTPRNSDPIHRVNAGGGIPEPVTVFDESRQEIRHMHPQFLPDGRHILYFVRSDREEKHTGTYLGSLDASASGRKIHADSRAIYTPPGYLLFVREKTLWAQPFDAQRMEKTGSAIPIAAPVASEMGYGCFSVSGEDVLVYRATEASRSQLVWLDRQGRQVGTVPAPEGSENPGLSPDGTRLAVDCPDPNTGARDLWLIELSRGNFSRFTFESSNDWRPIWSPDGSQIAYVSGPYIHLKNAGGVGRSRTILEAGSPGTLTWSPDGETILYSANWDIWSLPILEKQEPVRLFENDYAESEVQFSPDGRWFSYSSNESGQQQVYVQTFPPSGSKWQISVGGGVKARWRRDGKELFYFAPDQTLMSVQLTSDSTTFEHSAPQPLFKTRTVGYRWTYDVSPDGDRFVINTEVGDSNSSPITVVVNWMAALSK